MTTTVRSSSFATSPSDNHLTLAMPAGAVAGDLLSYLIHCNNVTTIADNNGATAANEDINDYQEASAGLTASLFSRRVLPGDPSTWDFVTGSTGRISGCIICWQNPHASVIYDVTSTNNQTGSATTIDALSVTTLTAGSIHCAVCGTDGPANTITPPGGIYTTQRNAGDQAVAFCTTVIAAPGATGNVTFPYANGNGAFTFSFAIRDSGVAVASLVPPSSNRYRGVLAHF